MNAPHMTGEEFRRAGHGLIEWIAQYLEAVGERRVSPGVAPGAIQHDLRREQPAPPQHGEAWERLFADFERLVMPGVTHWQSPDFYAYFPANVSGPAILGELLSAGLGVNGMLWATSPAVTELEMHVLDRLGEALNLPEAFRNPMLGEGEERRQGGGVIQDTASSASLTAMLCARERALAFASNRQGLSGQRRLVAYTSDQAHSSIEKAAMIAGIGSENLRLIATDERFAMRPEALREQVEADVAEGGLPFFVNATMGTTSSLAVDPLEGVGAVCREFGLWLHVDAAMAGSALVCPEFRWMARGLEGAESFVFNPHKWLLTNFDCSAFYVRDRATLIRTMSVNPEYLKTGHGDEVVNYRDWHIPLGRRFRALKVWFVLRHYGVEGLRAHIRQGVSLAEGFEAMVRSDGRFELVAPRNLNLVCFALKAGDEATRRLLESLNRGGEMLLTQTKLRERYAIRFCIGNPATTAAHVARAWGRILREADRILQGV